MINSAKKYTLPQVARISAGYALRTSAESLPVGDVRIIQLKNIDVDEGVNWNSIFGVSVPSKKTPNWLQNGDIIFAARSAKNIAVAIINPPQYAVCSPHFFIIRPKDSSLIDAEFLAWQINQKPIQTYFKRAAVGSSVMNIRRTALERLEITIPTPGTQCKIVNMWKTSVLEKQAFTKLMINRQDHMEAIAADLHHL